MEKEEFIFFDVTMQSYNGAEACELVGCYLFSELNETPGVEIGRYIYQTPKEIAERIKKDICKIFKTCERKITIEANKKVVNLLDLPWT